MRDTLAPLIKPGMVVYDELRHDIFGTGTGPLMDNDNVTALAAAGESETLEFKETTGTRREAAMTVCAFLNQRGGQVLFGVTQNGAVAGQQVSERTIEMVSAELGRIEPPAFPTVERVPVDDGRDVIVVSTARGASRPYTYRGSAYRRVGNTTLAMSPKSTTGCSSSGCTASSAGKTNPAPGGRSTTSTWRKFAGRSRRRSGAGDSRSL